MSTPSPLPSCIALFFEVSDGADDAGLERAFAQDASVLDEGRTHVGLRAVRNWLRQSRNAFTYRVEPLSPSFQTESEMTVPATVTGTFPGSPVVLDYRFRLRNHKIQQLEIQ